MATDQLVQELRLQLETDMLDYGWILQLVRDCEVDDQHTPITEVAYEAVARLLDLGVAEIGDAQSVHGQVKLNPWTGDLAERKSRLRSVIDQVGVTPELGQGFWIARSTRG